MSAFRTLLPLAAALAVAALAPASFAQNAPAAAAPAPVAAAPIPPEKQKLIDRILQLYHPENTVIAKAQHVATDTMEKAQIAMQGRVSKEKQDKTMKDISTDVQQYINTVTPLVAASAHKNVGPSVGPLLAQNFSVDELRQIVAMLEAPVKDKFEKLVPQMESAVGEKVLADVGPQVNQDIGTMSQAVGLKLRAAAIVNGQ